MGVRVKDAGKSEGRLVMSWIGVQAICRIAVCPTRKRADFQQVSHHKKVWQTVQSGKADDGKDTECSCIVSWCAYSRFCNGRQLYVCIVKYEQ